MKTFSYLLIYIILAKIILAKKLAIYTKLECPEPHTPAIAQYNCSLVKNSKGHLVLNIEMLLKEDLHHIVSKFMVKIRRGGKLEQTYLNLELDVCDSLSEAHKHFVLKLISMEILNSSNFPLECPLKKNVLYYVRNFSISDYYISPYIPELDWSTYTDYYVNKQKYLTFNSFGKIINN